MSGSREVNTAADHELLPKGRFRISACCVVHSGCVHQAVRWLIEPEYQPDYTEVVCCLRAGETEAWLFKCSHALPDKLLIAFEGF